MKQIKRLRLIRSLRLSRRKSEPPFWSVMRELRSISDAKIVRIPFFLLSVLGFSRLTTVSFVLALFCFCLLLLLL